MAPRVPVNAKFDLDLLEKIDEAAQADGLTRSAWLRDACRAKLTWRKLTAREREEIMPEVANG